jgi:23S rRNA (guanosine2251-2'-O)-methyltransferase
MTDERPPRPRRPRPDDRGGGSRPGPGRPRRDEGSWRDWRDDERPRRHDAGRAPGEGSRDRDEARGSGGQRDRGPGDRSDRGRGGYGGSGGQHRPQGGGRPWDRGDRGRGGYGPPGGGQRPPPGRGWDDDRGRPAFDDRPPGAGRPPRQEGGQAGGERGWSERAREGADRDRSHVEGEAGAGRPRPRPWRPPDRQREAPYGERSDRRPPYGRPAYGRPPGRGPDRDRTHPRSGDRDAGPPERRWGHDAAAEEPVTGPVTIGPDEEVVAGRRPVEEAFAARRPARRLLVVPERRTALDLLVLHATAIRIPVVEVEGGTLTSLSGFDGHQGVALVVEPRRWADLDDVIAAARDRDEPPLLLVLDSLEDPQNVGTLLRTAEATGVHGVLFPTRRSAPIGPSAVKASAGAVEHLRLAPMEDLGGALVDLHARGVRIVAADEAASLSYRDADLRGPLALVVGSEGQGLSATVRRRIDLTVRIPMRGRVASLNAAVAGSVLLFEAAAQRGHGSEVTTGPDEQQVAPLPTAGWEPAEGGEEQAAASVDVEAPAEEAPAEEAPAEEAPAEAPPGPKRKRTRASKAEPAATEDVETPTAGWEPAEGGEEQAAASVDVEEALLPDEPVVGASDQVPDARDQG